LLHDSLQRRAAFEVVILVEEGQLGAAIWGDLLKKAWPRNSV
jgi:hypothetical protein